MGAKNQLMGHMAALVCVFVWGVAYVVIVTLLQDFSPAEILFFRFSLATLALYFAYPKRGQKTNWRQELLLASAGLTGVTLYFLMQDFALMHTVASNVSVVVAVSPVFTVFLSWRFLGSGRPAWTFFLGAVLALCGIGLISFAGNQLEVHLLGDMFAMLAAFCWAVYCIFTKKLSDLGLHPIQSTRRIFSYGLLFLLPVILGSEFQLGLERFAQPRNIGNMLLLGLGSSALCFAFWNYALGQLGAVKTTVYVYAVPLVTVVASMLFLDVTITWLKALGIVFAIGGLILSNRRPKVREEVAAE